MSKYTGNIVTTGADTGYSVYFDGTGDFLSVADNAAFELNGDFTIEGWFYLTNTVTTEQDLVSKWYSSTNFSYLLYVLSGSLRFAYSANGTTTTSISGGTVALNTWFHAAVSGNAASGTIRLFLNGAQVATASTVSFYQSGTAPLYVMADNNGGTPIYSRGYASNVRVLKGTNLYTTAFALPTQLLPITNTSLLTCNSPAIIDQSSNTFTVTAAGDAKVSTFVPFAAGYQPYNPALGSSTPGIWTVSEALEAAATRRWNMYDPYFNNTVLALRTSSTDGLQNNTFIDSSSNNFSITRNGGNPGMTQGTFSPFSQALGRWSNYIGGATNYLTGTVTAISNTTMTMECWIYNNSLDNTNGNHYIQVNNATNANYALTHDGSGKARFVSRTDTAGAIFDLISATGIIQTNRWHHVVGVRTASNASLYVDGVRVATVASPTTGTITGTSLYISSNAGNLRFIDGYISNARIVSGTAMYDPSLPTLTVPTTPLSAPAGTRILTCQGSRFVDNSGSNVTISITGTASVQAFSPFQTNVAYTPELVGGSGYFDGTGDSLTRAFTSTTDGMYIQGSTYTIEAWVYPLALSGNQYIYICNASNVASYGYIVLYFNGALAAFATRPATGGTEYLRSGGTVSNNQWCHIAVSVSSNVAKLFLNGTQVGADLNVAPNTFTPTGAGIGQNQNGATGGTNFSGYIAGLRITQGQALASGNFTPPTAPVTTSSVGWTGANAAGSLTGTVSLLLNFTNSGIYDATGKNDLETVGNAQASIAVRNTRLTPVPATSIYFDGTADWLDYPIRGNDFGSGDFTIDLWFYKLSTGGQRLVSARSNNDGLTFGVNSSNVLTTFYGDVTVAGTITGTTTIAINTWYHVALVRLGGTTTLYLNGVVEGTPTSWSAKSFTSTAYRIGSSLDSRNEYFNGYISDLRIAKYARYLGNFTPPTSLTQNQ